MKKFALVGSEINYTLSPIIHQEIFKTLGVEGKYDVISTSVEQLPIIVERLKSYDGFNVTKPFKQRIIDYINECELKSVNTVKVNGGKFVGYSTDEYGFGRDIEKQFNGAKGNALVLGAGGVAWVIIACLQQKGFNVFVHNRTKEREREICKVTKAKEFQQGMEIDFVVNCTTLGWKEGENPIYENGKALVDIGKVKYAYDTVYIQNKTPFLQTFTNAKTANGLGMLILQAIEAERIFLGQEITPALEDCLYEQLIKKLQKTK